MRRAGKTRRSETTGWQKISPSPPPVAPCLVASAQSAAPSEMRFLLVSQVGNFSHRLFQPRRLSWVLGGRVCPRFGFWQEETNTAVGFLPLQPTTTLGFSTCHCHSGAPPGIFVPRIPAPGASRKGNENFFKTSKPGSSGNPPSARLPRTLPLPQPAPSKKEGWACFPGFCFGKHGAKATPRAMRGKSLVFRHR